MTAHSVQFTGPREVTVCEQEVPDPSAGELRVDAVVSAISPGTELLVYRGEAPTDVAADATIDAIDGTIEYPLSYGYANVGRVTAVGDGVDPEWRDRLVFAFHPHASRFLASPSDVLRVPDGVGPDRAAFLANVEAAIGFVMDGRPRIGERVVVLGQGPVGLLTTALLADFPLSTLVTVEPRGRRRTLSEAMGADESVPSDTNLGPALDALDARDARDAGGVEGRGEDGFGGADLVVEVSGRPEALESAIASAGYAGRVVVGSWYGNKRADIDLGGRFHRSHVRFRSSQVSRIDPDHAGRWDKTRRFDLAWRLLRRIETDRIVTHRLGIERAPEAYRLLDDSTEAAVQVLLTY